MKKEQLNNMVIGNLLKAKREDEGLSQSDVADKLEYKNYNMISIIESGRANLPLKRISDFVRVYGFDKIDSAIFLKKLHPEVWDSFMGITEEKFKTSKEFNEEIDVKFKKYLKDYHIQGFLKLQTS